VIDSLKSLWISQDQTNLAQFGEKNLQLLKSWGFCKSFFDEISEFPEREEYWKYNKFKGLKKREFQFRAPVKSNRISQKSATHFKVEIYDPSQSARWDIGENPYISPIGEILGDSQKMRSWSDFLSMERGTNFISLMNRSFLFSGIAISVPQGTSLRIDIQTHFDCGASEFIPFHLWARVEKEGRLMLSENTCAEDCEGLVFYDRLLQLGEKAEVHSLAREQGSPTSHIFQNTYVSVEKEGLWNNLDLTLPSFWSRHNTTATMVGEKAQSNLFGLYVNDQDYFCDHHTAVEHMRPSTFSNQIYKGVLGGTSEAVFNGKVMISEGSSLSNSQQLNKNLLLSEKAEIHTKPELKIYNDDVKAAHGATVGQLNDEQLFYLQSRGLTKEQAWDYLCQSFTGDVFQDFAGDMSWGGSLGDFIESVDTSLKTMRPGAHV